MFRKKEQGQKPLHKMGTWLGNWRSSWRQEKIQLIPNVHSPYNHFHIINKVLIILIIFNPILFDKPFKKHGKINSL